MRERFDVIIVGAGPAGSAAALSMAQIGLKTALIDRVDPLATAKQDLRTTALLSPSIQFLDGLGAWEPLRPRATALTSLRIVDRGEGDGPPLARTFEASETGSELFGWNIANADLKQALSHRLAEEKNLTIFAPAQLLTISRREDLALVTIEIDAGVRSLSAALLVAADGRNSFVRSSAAIDAKRLDLGHRATVFVARHPEPHQNLSIEFYGQGGPFTLVPFLDDADGAPRSSVVWMTRTADSQRLEAMDDATFAEIATQRSDGAFGPLTVASPRMSWKVESLLAEQFSARRLALMGEAAHAAPPIGAQGLNMSLADAVALSTNVRAAHESGADIGAKRLLTAYAHARRSDVSRRVGAIAALNIAADGAAAFIRSARRYGLAAAYDLKPVRNALMRVGLGA
ncbi:MAG: FAD-dependent monooxygenase [Neomegalonema sp.]|nr:FAD-dependent monooxygenase [Neomegalonema sp.]